MNYTIQQLDNMNFNETSHTSEELIKLARQMMRIKKHEKALEIIESAIKKIIDKHKGNQSNPEFARYYFYYADCLINKLMDQEDLLGNHYDSEDQINNIKEDTYNKKSDNEEDERCSESQITDEEIALDNLTFAEKILKEYDDDNSQDLLANVYLKLGELEMCKSKFKAAISYFDKALVIRKKIDNKFSRAIAELYFNMGSIYDYDSNKSLLCFYKTKVIIEYHLKNELKESGSDIRINEDDLESESVKIENIVFYKHILSNENLSEAAVELVDILNQIYLKVKYYNIDRGCNIGHRTTGKI